MQRYSKFEGLEPEEEVETGKTKRIPLEKKQAMEPGIRGQNKVSALAKDLAQKFKGEKSPPKEKKQPLVIPKAVSPLVRQLYINLTNILYIILHD